jgi:CheY-like chemotaxis protein
VLIIEDTPENLRLFRAILRLESARVLEAERAPTGIELAVQEQPDIVLMDMQMPGMDGLTAARLLRSDPRTAHIPIVVVTASTMDDDRCRALEAGCDGYIVKPVDPLNFGRQIASYLESKSSDLTPLTSEEWAVAPQQVSST